jgi:hypothetical protein
MATANELIKKAVSQIGVKENPSGSNKVKYNTDYYGRVVSGSAYPWCCAFIWWIFKECNALELFHGGRKTAYCPTVETYYKSKGQWHKSNPKVGDLVLFDFSGKGVAEHIGILEKINADGTYSVIEGNTSTTSNDNGGCVMRRVRKKSVIRGFARPKYDTTVKPKETQTTTAKPSTKLDPAQSFSKSYAKTYKVTAKSGLNMRCGAGTNKSIITTLKTGATFRCYGYYTKQSDGTIWLYGVGGGKTGFCSKAYLS